MYFIIYLRRFSFPSLVRNIGIPCIRKLIFMLTYSKLVALLYNFDCLKAADLMSQLNNGRIKFALVDMNWKRGIIRQDLTTVEYWLSRSNNEKRFSFCYGKHFFKEDKIYPAFFVCTRGLSFINHEPLHSLELNYRDDWKIKFCVLNDYLSKNPIKPFLFEGHFGVSYQLFETFVKYMTFDSSVLTKNVPYELFYKLIKLTDLLDPISSDSLSKFYSDLYKNGLMNSTSFANIMTDSHCYLLRYFDAKNHQRPFMYFFGVLNDSLDACLIPDISTLSIFQKKNQYIDQCFRYTENVSRLVLKISASSLELLMSGFTDEMRIFNWLLSVTEIAGFYLDDTEYTFNPIKCQNICGFINPEVPIKTPDALKAIPSDFFVNLSEGNQRRIAYLRFVNIDICFDLIKPLLRQDNVTFFEMSYCNISNNSQITDLSKMVLRLNVFKLRDFKLKPDDMYLIINSKIKVLVLSYCTSSEDGFLLFSMDHRYVYEIAKNLRTLDISSSRLPMFFIQLLCFSSKLENINISCFEFLPTYSIASLICSNRKLDCLEINEYIPNDNLKSIVIGISANCLSLCKPNIFRDVMYFFRTSTLLNSVKSLDLSDNILPSYFFNLIEYFRNLKRLRLSTSLPCYIDYSCDLRIYKSLTDLDISHNNLTRNNHVFVSRFLNLKTLNLKNVKLEDGLFKNILTDNLTNSLISLDISGIVLRFCEFKRILCCKRLKIFHFKISNIRPLFYYFDILSLTAAKNSLSILSVELESDINFDDLLSLAGFYNLIQVKITCNKFIGVGEEDLIKFNFKNSEFRFELCLRDYNLDNDTLEILREIFDNYSSSFVSL